MTHGPGVKNASRQAERFWPDERRHKQSLGAVYTASAVYMLGYQRIHQLVSVDFFKKRLGLGFPETQVCVCLRCSGVQVGGASLQAWPEGLFLSFFSSSSSPPKPHKMSSHHASVLHSHQSHTVLPKRFMPVHISTFLAAVPAGTPGNARPRPVSACGNSSWWCRQTQSSVSQ